MTLKVTTSDDKTVHFPGTVPVIVEGGVLVVTKADGSSVRFSPSYWQKAEMDAPAHGAPDSIH